MRGCVRDSVNLSLSLSHSRTRASVREANSLRAPSFGAFLSLSLSASRAQPRRVRGERETRREKSNDFFFPLPSQHLSRVSRLISHLIPQLLPLLPLLPPPPASVSLQHHHWRQHEPHTRRCVRCTRRGFDTRTLVGTCL